MLALPGGIGGPPPPEPASWSTTARAVEPLTAAEERDPAVAAIARRFNPAMALPAADGPWPVSVRYTWSGGADLQARTLGPDGEVKATATARAGAELDRTPWDQLPVNDPSGNRIEYWIDGPGDDRAVDAQDGQGGQSEWRRRWRASDAKTPTQYAHAFWLNRARGELVVQYWFFYPFNEWINHHEGDWEHVNVVLAGPPAQPDRSDRSQLGRASEYRAIGLEYYFHGSRLDTDQPVRAAGSHPVVFVGGRGRVLWWSGDQSGGSYPWPASYRGAAGGFGPFAISDDTRRPARILDADAFDVVMLPEPARLDARAHPELSWLRLPFFAGQSGTFANPPLVDRFGGGKVPRQPARRADWNAIGSRPLWSGTPTVEESPPVLARAGDDPDGVSAVHP